MKKFLIGGVSLFAIFATSNAMAAGYTCEELIEYTSCMGGYYLSSGAVAPQCPDGYRYITGACDIEEDPWEGYASAEECAEAYCDWYGGCEDISEAYGQYLGDGCLKSGYDEEVGDWDGYDFISMSASGGTDCVTCPIGSTCAGGTAGAVECPAGSYCATAGLSQPTGLCAQNTWSIAGSSECEPCPATNLTDKDGKTVVAKTSGNGSTSASACFIDPNAYFKDDKGVFHFKSNCSYQGLKPGTSSGGGNVLIKTEQQACEHAEGAEWSDGQCNCSGEDVGPMWNYFPEYNIAMCSDHEFMTLKADCESYDGTWDWTTAVCDCPNGGNWDYCGDSCGYCE